MSEETWIAMGKFDREDEGRRMIAGPERHGGSGLTDKNAHKRFS